MMGFGRVAEYSIEIGAVDATKCAHTEKLFPLEWIKRADISDEFLTYARLLIEGEVKKFLKTAFRSIYNLDK